MDANNWNTIFKELKEMQVNLIELFKLVKASSDVPNSSEQDQKVSRFVDEHFERLKEEAEVMTKAQRSWALNHVVSLNGKIGELAEILRSAPQQLAPTEATAEVRKALDRALLVEGLDRWVADPNTTGKKVEARSRILDAFDKRDPELNLNQLGLNTLPPEIGQLAHLQHLYLGSNQLSALPAEIVHLAQLQVLNLSINQFSTLPAEILHLAQLQKLSLWKNQLSTLPREIGQLAQLDTLYLSKNRFSILPREIWQLVKLQHLLLDDNRFSTLPAEIGLLVQLKKLKLSNNQFSTLPTEIGLLTQLEELYIESNPDLAELPMALGACSGITTLGTEGTQIPRRVVRAILALTRTERSECAHFDLPRRIGVWRAAMDTYPPALVHIENLEDSEKVSINEWLTRLERCRDFTGNQKEMAQVVLRILESLKDHPEFKELYFAQVNANLECCEDRAAMSLNEIYTAHLIETSESPALKTLVGVAKTFALRKAVMGALAGTEDQGESVETYLRYESALRERLGLVTAIKSGRFTGMGRALDENALIAAVESNFLSELFEIPMFQALAMKDKGYKETYDRIYEDCSAGLESISSDLPDHEYQSEVSRIEEERRLSIRGLRTEWMQINRIQYRESKRKR